VASNGMVFVPEATVSALDEKTGHKIWEFTPEANASLGRATVDGPTLYFGTANHHLYAVRASDGQELWMRDLGPDWKNPAVVRGIAVRKDKIYVTVEQWRSPNGRTASGWLIALKASNGKVLWRYHTGEGDQRRGLSSSPAVTDKLVVCADYLSNAIIAVDRRKGQELWRFQGEIGFVGFPEAPLIEDGEVFIGSGDTYVYALDLSTGHRIWRTKLSGAVEAYALCGKSLLVNEQGFVTLDRRTGSVEETLYTTEAEFPSSGFAIVGKQAMVAGPKAVYAFVCP
jgi:outer membrane protein assembly factor BamB